MKRENLQRANELEKQISDREAKLCSMENKPCVTISRIAGGSQIVSGDADNLSDVAFERDAFVFLQNVRERMKNEIDSLLKEMEEL